MTPAIERLFLASFPENERRPLAWFRELAANEPRMHLVTYDADANPVPAQEDKMRPVPAQESKMPHVPAHDGEPHPGDASITDERAMLCYWHFDTFIYVEYLAVDPTLRGGGIGRRIMERLVSDSMLPVILEVEPPTDQLTTRRVAFYQRLGFQLLPDPYVQPSYGVVPGMPLRLMLHSLNAPVPPPPVAEMVKLIHRHVYGQKPD